MSGRIVRGRPELSSFSRAYIGYAGKEGFAVRFSKMSFMVHCDFDKGNQNKIIRSNLLVGREGGGHTKIVLGVLS